MRPDDRPGAAVALAVAQDPVRLRPPLAVARVAVALGLFRHHQLVAAEGALRLAARIRDKQLSEQQAKTASTRKSLIGSGDRSQRIRTYNFPQGRVTDHRINLTLYKIERIMDGELDELINALANEHQAEQLTQLTEEAA